MEIEFLLDGETVRCPEGISVAAAVFHTGRCATGIAPRTGTPRALFCGMGVCFECVTEIDGRPGTRSCVTLVVAGMRVVTQRGVSGIGESR